MLVRMKEVNKDEYVSRCWISNLNSFCKSSKGLLCWFSIHHLRCQSCWENSVSFDVMANIRWKEVWCNMTHPQSWPKWICQQQTSLHLVLHSLHHPEALAEVKKAKREKQKEWCRNVGLKSFGRTGSCLHSKPHSLVYCHEGKCPHCWVGRPWLRWSEGPPSGKFGETTGWRSANIAVNSTSLSPWLPAGVYLKIPDVKVTEYFVRLVSAAGLCQYLGILMYSDEMGVNRDCLWRMENSMLSPCCCISVRTVLSCIPIGLLIQQCLTVDFPFFSFLFYREYTGILIFFIVWWISA